MQLIFSQSTSVICSNIFKLLWIWGPLSHFGPFSKKPPAFDAHFTNYWYFKMRVNMQKCEETQTTVDETSLWMQQKLQSKLTCTERHKKYQERLSVAFTNFSDTKQRCEFFSRGHCLKNLNQKMKQSTVYRSLPVFLWAKRGNAFFKKLYLTTSLNACALFFLLLLPKNPSVVKLTECHSGTKT